MPFTTLVCAALLQPKPDVPLIPRTVLFGNPERMQPQISPDGKMLALIKPSAKGVLNIWTRPTGGGTERIATKDSGNGIYSYRWSADGKRLLYFQDRQGDEVQHLFSVDLPDGAVRDLTPFVGVRAQNLLTSSRYPNTVIVGLNLRNRKVFDMYRIDLSTGACSLDTQNPGDVLSWTVDSAFQIRACSAIDPKDASTSIRTRSSSRAPWRTIWTVQFEQSLQNAQANGGNAVVGFAPGGRSLYIVSAKDSDTARLLRINAYTGRLMQVVASDPKADVEGDIGGDTVEYAVLSDPGMREIQAVGFNYQKLDWHVVNPEFFPHADALTRVHPGVWSVESMDAASKKWVVRYTVDDGPTSYYLYDKATKRASLLFDDVPELKKWPLAKVRPIEISTRDNRKLVGYLTLPVGSTGKGLPLVMIPHGGPWWRDRWGWDSEAQLLANRGYAVLHVNFRGSTGYGVKFMNAATGGWGTGVMQNDVTDAVHWAIAQGIADPEKVAIMGASYGGYATLAGVTFTPELYTCGIDIVGPSDVATLLGSIPDYWGPIKKRWIKRIGLAPADYSKISPLARASEIRVPLLIGHGANDPRVALKHSETIVAALRKREIPVTFVVYPDEGHGFGREENVLDFYGRVEEFLAKYLGGRAEAFDSVKGSSAQLR